MARGRLKSCHFSIFCRDIRRPSFVVNWSFPVPLRATANMFRIGYAMCAPEVLSLLCRPKSHMYICGLKGIEEGVDEALVDIGRLRGIDWLASKSEMRAAGRYHVESY